MSVNLLRELILFDHDAIAAYEAAIERLDGGGDKRALSTFGDDQSDIPRIWRPTSVSSASRCRKTAMPGNC